MRRGDAFGATGGATPLVLPAGRRLPQRRFATPSYIAPPVRESLVAPGGAELIWEGGTDGGGRKKKKPPVRKSPVAPGGAGLVWKEGFCAEMEKSRKRCAACDALERVMGIEPTLPAWKAGALPLSYTRIENEEVLTPSLPPLER